MRRGPLAALALVAGCLQPGSHECADGWVCPEELACAPAPTYCGTPSEVSACSASTIDGHDTCMTMDVPDGVCVGGECAACTPDYESCTVAQWTAMTNTSGDLSAVWVSSARDAIAVGSMGVIVHYDGAAWTTQPRVSQDLKGVWTSPAGQTYVIENQEVDTYTLGGTPAAARTTTNVLNGLWGTGSDVFAVGQNGAIEHFDGMQWTDEMPASGAPALKSVGGTSTDVYAVGTPGAVLHRQGTQWIAIPLPPAYANALLKAVWASGSQLVVAGATAPTSAPTILHYSSGTWTASAASADATGVNVFALWGSGPSDLFAAGTNSMGTAGVILHYDGQMWSVATTVPKQLAAIGGVTPDDVIAVGQSGTILRYAP